MIYKVFVKLLWCCIFYILASSTLAQLMPYLFSAVSKIVSDCNTQRTDHTTATQTNTERDRDRERETLEPESLMSFLTRFGDEGKSSIRKIVSLFSSPLSAKASIVTHSSADETHPLLYHPICTPFLLAKSPTHYSYRLQGHWASKKCSSDI